MPDAYVAPQRRPDLGDGPSALNPGDRAVRIGAGIVFLSLVSAFATYLILTGLTPIPPRGEVVLIVLFVNVVLIVAMIGLLTWQVIGLARAWRQRIPGARLHIRIVALFSVIAALPTLLLAVGATVTFSRSLDSWFSTRTREIVSSSLDVAAAYLDEHGQVIRTDIVNMARDLDAAADSVGGDTSKLQRLVMVQAGLRELPAAYIIERDGSPVVEATENAKLTYKAPSAQAIAEAQEGQVPLLMPTAQSYRVAAVTKLEKYPGKFLYVARGVSPTVINHLQLTAQNVDEFNRLRKARGGLKIAHGLMYLDDLDDGAAGRHLGRLVVCRPLRRSDPPSHRRRAGGLQGQPDGRAAREARRGRSAAAVEDIQHHDARAEAPARRARRRPTSSCSSGATSWRRCCRASRPASSASTARTASRSSAAPPAIFWVSPTRSSSARSSRTCCRRSRPSSTRETSTRSRCGPRTR